MNFPIVLATDKNYLVPTYVAISSLLRHLDAKMKDRIDIYILCSSSIDNNQKEYFNKLHKNIYFEEVHLSKLNLSDEIDYVSMATYYRLLIPEKFRQYDKCLYLDSDIVVVGDITPLVQMEFGNNLIIGCKNYFSKECYTDFYKQRCRECGIDSLDTYVNAGVLLINIKELRNEEIGITMLQDVSKNTYRYNDQDIINKYFYGKIGLMSAKYNFMVQYLKRMEIISKVLKEDLYEVVKEPVIIHYSTKKKPWRHRGYLMAEYWEDEIKHIEDVEVVRDLIKPFIIKQRKSRRIYEIILDNLKFVLRKYVQHNFTYTIQKKHYK